MTLSNTEIAIYMLVGLIIGFVVHEFMHAYVAYRMGDTTAKRAGRLTLDPLAHLDPVGSVLLPGLLFLLTLMGRGGFIIGYAKPVPINPFLFKKRTGIIWVSLAGPLSNLLVGVIFLGIVRILTIFEGGTTFDRIIYTCIYIADINILLFIFNLIPIPPLDGSRVLGYFLHGRAAHLYQSIEPFGFMIVLLLVLPFGFVLNNVVNSLLELIMRMYGL